MKNASKVSAANVLNAIVKHPHNRTGANKEGFYKLSRKFEIALFGEGAPEVGTVVTDGTNSITVVSVEMNNQDGSINGVRCVEGKLNAAEAAKAGAAFGGHFLTYNFFLPSSMPKMVEIELNAETAEVIAPVAEKVYPSIAHKIADNQAVIDRMVYLWERWQDEKEYEDFAEYEASLEMVALEQGFELLSLGSRPFKAVFAAEVGKQAVITIKAKGNKLQVEGATEPLSVKKAAKKATPAAPKTALVQVPVEEVKAGLDAEIEAEFGLTADEKAFIETNFKVDGEVAIFYANQMNKANAKMAKSIAAKLHTFVDNASGIMVPTSWLPAIFAAPVADSTPTLEELEERINDLPVKKGRGYANAGKKYEHSGVRIEEFKLGKAKVKKGDKLYFKIGKEEVVGIFSHLNQCVHCPEGYAVIRFNGKNYERRQSRISTTPSAE